MPNQPTMSKQEREREALIQSIAAKGNERPQSSDLSHILGPGAAVTVPATVILAASDVEQAAGGRRLRRVTVTATTPKVPKPPAKARPAKPPKPAKPAPPDAPAATAPQHPVPPAEPAASPVATAEAAAPAAMEPPWTNAHPKMLQPYSLRLDEATHMKLAWLKTVLPNTSIQKIIMQGITGHVDALVAKHWPPASGK